MRAVLASDAKRPKLVARHMPLLGGLESNSLLGFLFYARQTLRLAGPAPAELSLALHGFAVDERGPIPLEPEARAQVIRTLLDATVRQRPEEASVLVDEMRKADAALKIELMRPTEVEMETQLRHVVFPLLAAVVG